MASHSWVPWALGIGGIVLGGAFVYLFLMRPRVEELTGRNRVLANHGIVKDRQIATKEDQIRHMEEKLSHFEAMQGQYHELRLTYQNIILQLQTMEQEETESARKERLRMLLMRARRRSMEQLD